MNAKTLLLVVVLAAIGGAIFYLESLKPARLSDSSSADIPLLQDVTVGVSTASGTPASQPALSKPMPPPKTVKNFPRAKEIVNPSGFINTANITIRELIGKKVILVDFWTFSCINCQRTTPYLNAWYQKYREQGLEIVGVHTPEFQFEQKYENVAAAVKNGSIKYPVVLDNSYSTWTVYGNRFWPRKYLIDIDGYIVYDHIGEGAYEETERKIQELLRERMTRLNLTGEIVADTSNPGDVIETDFSRPRSPEIYFGASRNSFLGNGASGVVGAQTLSEPASVKTNTLYLVGGWNFQNEFAENVSMAPPSTSPSAVSSGPNGSGPWKIIFRYQGKNVYLVASAASGAEGVKIKLLRDGKPLGEAAGRDVVKENGFSTVTIGESRLYRLIEDPGGYGEHTLEIIIEKPGLRAYTFTFG